MLLPARMETNYFRAHEKLDDLERKTHGRGQITGFDSIRLSCSRMQKIIVTTLSAARRGAILQC